MRKFDYRNGVVKEAEYYIASLEIVLKLLDGYDSDLVLKKTLIEFKDYLNIIRKKYDDFYELQNNITAELISPASVDRIVNGVYPEDASKIGMEFQKDLCNLFELEDRLSKILVKYWKKELTDFDNFENGADFRIVGTVNPLHNLPGGVSYKIDEYHHSYLSASLFSNNTIAPFMNEKTVIVCDVDDDNLLAASPIDIATREKKYPSIFTIGKTQDGKYIDSGYTISKDICYKVLTPTILERLRFEKDLEKQNIPLYRGGVNEVILDKTVTKLKGILLINSGLDCLLNEYIRCKYSNNSSLKLPIKCLNKTLYQNRFYEVKFTEKDYLNFQINLDNAINKLYDQYDYNVVEQILNDYYNEVVLPMKYDDNALEIIKSTLKKYVDNINYNK